MVGLTKEEVQDIEMDIESCPVCGGTGKVALFDGECISYEACPDSDCNSEVTEKDWDKIVAEICNGETVDMHLGDIPF
jgi:hypothetical protein